MRARGQGLLACLVLIVLVGAGVAADRVGPRPEPAAEPGRAPSGAWICPHGGGQGWRTTLYLANPSATTSSVLVTALSAGVPRLVATTEVPAGVTLSVAVPSSDLESATSVEWFGGQVVAGWVAVAGGNDQGITAEPCGVASDVWFAPDGSTSQGSEATYLVVSNPTSADSVFSVVLYAADRAPIRETKWTNLVLPADRSIALLVDRFAVNEVEVAAEVDVTTGRVGVASLGISQAGGVRSSMGTTSLSERVFLPVAAGVGQSELVLLSPAQPDITFDATLLSGQAAQPAGALTQATQGGQSAKSYPIITNGPSSVDVQTQGGALIAAALRSTGSSDSASTGGAAAPATSWVVLPTVAGSPAHPGLVLVNPGAGAAEVTLHVLAASGVSAPSDITVEVGPASAILVPSAFLTAAPGSAILVSSPGVPVLASGASTSTGTGGVQGYAIAMGVPVAG